MSEDQRTMTEAERKKMEEDFLGLLPDGLGLEELGFRDLQTTFLSIIQRNSPELDKDDARFVEDWEAGDIVDKKLKVAYEDIVFLPVKYIKLWVEWVPQSKGGGWVANHAEPLPTDRNFQIIEGNHSGTVGNDLNLTYFFIGYIINQAQKSIAIIAMDRSNIEEAKNWLTTIFNEKDSKGNSRPMGFKMFRVMTAVRRNRKGSWYGWEVKTTKGTIVNWAHKYGFDIHDLAREITQLSENARRMFVIGDKQEARKQLSPGKQNQEVNDEEDDDDDLPF